MTGYGSHISSPVKKASHVMRPGTMKAVTSRRLTLSDPHQVNTIIASAICDCRKNHPDGAIAGEEAKQIAKCVVEHLSNAGFVIVQQDERTE
jgi:hypothetical protein